MSRECFTKRICAVIIKFLFSRGSLGEVLKKNTDLFPSESHKNYESWKNTLNRIVEMPIKKKTCKYSWISLRFD